MNLEDVGNYFGFQTSYFNNHELNIVNYVTLFYVEVKVIEISNVVVVSCKNDNLVRVYPKISLILLYIS